MPRFKITHIINPVIVNKSSDLYFAQPITFETMKKAKYFAKKSVIVELYATCFKKDSGFKKISFRRRNFSIKLKFTYIKRYLR